LTLLNLKLLNKLTRKVSGSSSTSVCNTREYDICFVNIFLINQ